MADVKETIDIELRNKVQKSIERDIQAIGLAAKGTDLQLKKLQVTVNSTTGTVKTTSQIAPNFDRATNSIKKTTTATKGLSQEFLRTLRNLRTIAGIVAIISAARVGVRSLDQFQNLRNQLRSVTESEEQLNQITDELFDISKRARVPVTELGTTFRRFDLAIKELGGGQKETLRIVETVSKLLTIGGASGQETTAALQQLSQAFNAAKLNGDEFRSVSELMPEAIRAISEVTGVARKDMKEFAKDGSITSDVLRKAFFNLAEFADKQIEETSLTLGQAFTRLADSFTRWFGELDESFGITQKFGGALVLFADNLNVLEGFIIATGIALTAYMIPALKAATAASLTFLAANPAVALVALGAAGAGALIAFRDEIKLSSDNMVTFGDVLRVFGKVGRELFDKFTLGAKIGLSLLTNALVGTPDSLEAAVKIMVTAVATLQAAWNELMLTFRAGKATVVLTGQLIQSAFTLDSTEFLSQSAQAVAEYQSTLKQIEQETDRSNQIIQNSIQTTVDAVMEIFRNQARERIELEKKTREALRTGGDPNGGAGGTVFPQFGPVGNFADPNEVGKVLNSPYSSFAALPGTFQQLSNVAGHYSNTLSTIVDQTTFAADASQEWFEIQSQAYVNALDLASQYQQQASQAILGVGEAFAKSFEKGKFNAKKFFVGFLGNLIKFFVAKRNENFAFGLARATGRGGIRSNQADGGQVGAFFAQARPPADAFAQAVQATNNDLLRMTDIAQAFRNGAVNSFNSAAQAVDGLAQSLGRAIAEAANLQSIFNSFDGPGIGDGGFGLGGFSDYSDFGFRRGGYTGNIPRNRIAGVTHGQEFVMPAGPTRQYRGLLEAMRAGKATSGAVAATSSGPSVVIQNYGGANVNTRTLSDGQILVLIDEARASAVKQTARELRSSGSRTSRNLTRSTNSRRTR